MDYIEAKENIQEAVREAVRQDVRTVVIKGEWHLEEAVQLPDCVTVILAGATIFAKGCAFVNEKAEIPYALATEQQQIHIVGIDGARIVGGAEPQIKFFNVQAFSVSGVSFAGGSGVLLRHARKGKVRELEFDGSTYGVRMEEGCRELILSDIQGKTKEETVCWYGGDTTVWGRSHEICQSILCRVHAQTEGAPVVSIRQGAVPAENMILRDITDATASGDFGILIGDGTGAVKDVTVRNVASERKVQVGATCDGIFVTAEAEVNSEATRVLTAAGETPAAPERSATECKKWISANDPAYAAETDGETLQKAIDAAAAENATLVIPRCNGRTGEHVWEIGGALRVPSHARIVLLDAHLRMADYTYCNMFVAEGVENVAIVGIGSATLDSGIPNGLKLKNAGKLGFGPITDNALICLAGARNVRIEGVEMWQSRWYGVYCVNSKEVNVSNITFYAPPIFPDLGGVYVAGGCEAVSISNITGITGADGVLVEATEKMGAADIQNVHIFNMLSNVSRCCMVRVFCHDGYRIKNVVAESIIDSSVPEQKKQPRAMACIGQWQGSRVKPLEVGDLSDITVRDVCGRSAATVELGGMSEGVYLENIHSFGNTGCGVRCSTVPEVEEFVVKDLQEKLCAYQREKLTVLKECAVDGLFFRCQQASAYMRGTATSIISDKKKFVGKVMDLSGLEAESMHVKNVFAQPVGNGIFVSGKANVTVENLQIILCGREETVCRSGCSLTVDGKKAEITTTVKL